MTTKTTKPAFPAWLVVLYLFSAVSIIIGGLWYYRAEGERLRENAVNQLTSVAHLKISQIATWREERIKEAAMISHSTFFIENVDRWLETGDPDTERNLRSRLDTMHHDLLCSNILIVDTGGNIRMSYVPTIKKLRGGESERAFVVAKKTGHPAIIGLSRHTGNADPHFHIITPLFRETKQGRKFIGAVVLVEDARKILFPLIKTWPTLSRSAETLLVTRDDGSVLFLNDLRFQKDAALRLRIPLTRDDVPAVKAVKGVEGVFEGLDYRGVRVVSVLQKVPGTRWKMIAKMDSAEIFEAKNRQMLMLAVLMMLLLTGSFSLISGLWQMMQKRHFREAYMAEVAREAMEKHFEYLIRYANDIILLSDETGKLEMANNRALETTGYTRNEITGMSVMELVRPEAADALRTEYEKVSEKGASIFDFEMKAKDGHYFPVEVSMRAIEVEGRRYFQAIIRDVTERKAAEEALKLSEERMVATLFSIGDGVISSDANGNVMMMNTVAERLTGWMSREAMGRPVTEVFNIVNMFSGKTVESPVEKVLREGKIVGLANHTVLISKNGREYQIADSGAPIKTADGRVIGVVLVFRDVTKEYWMRNELNKSEQRYRNLVEYINTCVVVYEAVDGGSDFIIREFNSAAERAEKVNKEEVIGKKITEAFPNVDKFGILELFRKV